ncbi:MAG: cation:proton antiporter [Halofilum sp. (in: g-proteobacteria)]|nr:cation:proton antiporter [Halofilum sp. (in: g-proteobacteria)]
MHTPEAFTELLLLLLIALAAAAFFIRLRLPAALGYLAVGVATGPSALALVQDTETIRQLAELGVVLLLFTIGLQFSLPALVRMRGALLGLGGAEVGIAAIATTGMALWLGIALPGAIVLGGVVAMSSTALVTKQLSDQYELGQPHGRAALGILLFQDIAVVPFLVIVSGLAQTGDAAIGMALVMAALKGTAAIVVILAAGRFLLRPALHGIAALHSGELFTLTALAVALAAAWLTSTLGLSPALGAFVAGMMLGESAYRHTIEAEIRPFRDVLLALFFVTIGMLLDLSVLPIGWPWILLLFSGLVVFKFVLVFALGWIARMPMRAAVRTALVLAHGGEFGFAILSVSFDAELLPPAYGQVVLASLLLSMAVAPLALRFNEAMTTRLEPGREGDGPSPSEPKPEGEAPQVIIVGFGRVGQLVAQMLDRGGYQWVAFDVDPVRVQNARAAGENVHHGDGTQLDVLRSAGVDQARALALTLNDLDAEETIAAVHRVRTVAPELPVLVRTGDDALVEELREAGATEIVPETLEAGLMVASHVLLLLGESTEEVTGQLREIRHDRYQLLRALFPGSGDWDPDQSTLRAVQLPADARAVGRALGALDFAALDVRVPRVQRGGRLIEPPGEEMQLEAGDVVVLAGKPDRLDRAEVALVRG